jgi:hypothetical protein
LEGKNEAPQRGKPGGSQPPQALQRRITTDQHGHQSSMGRSTPRIKTRVETKHPKSENPKRERKAALCRVFEFDYPAAEEFFELEIGAFKVEVGIFALEFRVFRREIVEFELEIIVFKSEYAVFKVESFEFNLEFGDFKELFAGFVAETGKIGVCLCLPSY